MWPTPQPHWPWEESTLRPDSVPSPLRECSRELGTHYCLPLSLYTTSRTLLWNILSCIESEALISAHCCVLCSHISPNNRHMYNNLMEDLIPLENRLRDHQQVSWHWALTKTFTKIDLWKYFGSSFFTIAKVLLWMFYSVRENIARWLVHSDHMWQC